MDESGGSPIQSVFDREIKDVKSINFWRAVFAEYIGTLILFMWSIGSSLHDPQDASPPDPLVGAICTGFVVAVVINSLLNVSGGHVNPAVSIGLLVLRKITFVRFIFYVCAQCLAGLSAVAILSKLTPEEMTGLPALIRPAEGITNAQAFFYEFSIGFFLLFSIAALIDDKRADNTSPVPFYVGLIVAGNILFAARTSGGCMNPARNLGPAIITGRLETQWVYFLGPLLGGATGTFLYDQFLSVKAISGSSFITSCCKEKEKSRDRKTTRPAESSNNEKERMLTTEA